MRLRLESCWVARLLSAVHIRPTALKQAPWEDNIVLLYRSIVFRFTEKRAPFIDDHDKLFAGGFCSVNQCLRQICSLRDIGKGLFDLFPDREQGNAQIDDIVLVEMPFGWQSSDLSPAFSHCRSTDR